MEKRFFVVSAHPGVDAMPAIRVVQERCPYLHNLIRLRLVRQEVASRTGWWSAIIAQLPLQEDQATQRLDFTDEYPERALSDVPEGIIVFDETCRIEFENLIKHARADVLGNIDARNIDAA